MSKIKIRKKFCIKKITYFSLQLEEENMFNTITTLIIITVVVIIGRTRRGVV